LAAEEGLGSKKDVNVEVEKESYIPLIRVVSDPGETES